MAQRYVHGVFQADYKATIGTFISKKQCDFEKLNTSVKFIIWDLAGQDQFQRLWPDYLTDTRAGIIVFDVTNRKSFENVKKWYDIITKVADPNVHLILVGNKSDLQESKEVSSEEGAALAKELKIYYMETSVKTNENIDEVFESIALKIINQNVDVVQETIGNKAIEEHYKYIISASQIRLLSNYFTKQLDFCIGKSDTENIIKYLDTLKVVEKNRL